MSLKSISHSQISSGRLIY